MRIHANDTNKILEIAAVAVIFLILIGLEWRVVGSQELMVERDSVITYSAFYNFADSLLKGNFAYWNPYTNAGDTNFLLWQLSYFLRPTILICLFFAKIFHLSLLSVFQRELLIMFMVFCLGAYLFFRKIFQSKVSAYIAFVVLTLSSLSGLFWWQIAFTMAVYTLPWALLLTLYFFEGKGKALMPAAIFIGISLLGIYGMFFIFYFVLFWFSLWLFGALKDLKIIQLIKDNSKYVVLFFVILFLLTFNLIPQFFYKDSIVPISRLLAIDNTSRIAKGIEPTFDGLFMSFHVQFFDFLSLLFPHFATQYFTGLLPWVYSTYAVMYIGLIPLVLLVIGLLWGRHKYKWGIFFATIILMFLMLGTRAFALQYAYYFFPMFSWVQNMAIFLGFFIFNLCFFIGLGADVIMVDIYTNDFSRVKKYISVVVCLGFFYILSLGSLALGAFLIMTKFKSALSGSGVGLETLEKLPTLFSSFVSSFFYTIFFLLIAGFFFYLLIRKDLSLKHKIIFFAFFIVIDLLTINSQLIGYMTKKRSDIYPQYQTETKYEDKRILRMTDLPKDFRNFYPSALFKKFTAYSTTEAGKYTHLIESKDFYEFRTNFSIPVPVKNIILGIDAPKLRLLPQAIMAPKQEIIKLLEKASLEDINKTTYIEETIPASYSFLISNNYSSSSIEALTGKIEVLKFDSNRLELKVTSNQDSFLYYSDGYDKYWTATIDNKPTKIYKTNLAFKSIILPKGEHKVVFLYNPLLFKIGVHAYLITLIIGGLWGLKTLILRYFLGLDKTLLICYYKSIVKKHLNLKRLDKDLYV